MKRTIIILLILTLAIIAIGDSIILDKFTGELSPFMGARYDLPQYQTGLRELTNMVVETQGGVAKRPGTYYINGVVGEVPGTPADATYKFTYISESGKVWGIPVGDAEMTGLDADGVAVDVGGGIVGLPFVGHPFTAGESIQITGTTNYNGAYTVEAGTTEDAIYITDDYNAETFDGTELIVKYITILAGGQGPMAQDSDGNLYCGHFWLAAQGTYITKIETDGTLVYDFITIPDDWPYDNSAIESCKSLVCDDTYLYAFVWQDYTTDDGYVYKFNLSTGDLLWTSPGSAYTTWPGNDMAIDDDGNAYAIFTNGLSVVKFDADDGTATKIDLPQAGGSVTAYVFAIEIANDKVIVAGSTVQNTTADPTTAYNVVIMDLDGSNQVTLDVGGYYENAGLRYSPVIGTGHVITHGDYIYFLTNKNYNGAMTIFKYDFDGNLISEATVATYAQGLYIDLYENIVVIEQNTPAPQNDVLWFYDLDLEYVGKVEGMYNTMFNKWDDAVYGGLLLQGNAFFDGVLGTEATPAVPSDYGEDLSGEPVRIIDYTYRTEESYIVECGQHYMVFYKEAD